MTFGRNFIAPLAAALFIAVPMVRAAEDTPAKPSEADLQAKVKALEDRVRTLEDELSRAHTRNKQLNGWRQQQGQRFGQDLNAMLDRMQRQMQEDFGANFGPNFPGFDINGSRGFATTQKPRLGVEMAPPTDEYRERFKNDVKEGSFVVEVVPGSPAEKAGLMKGDAVVSFNNKAIKSPEDLKEAVSDAPKGVSEVTVMRRGERKSMKVDLEENNLPADVHAPGGLRQQGGWLRRGDTNGASKSRTEVKASALEMSDEMARDLGLNADQRKKMSDVLASESKSLSEDVAAQSEDRNNGQGGVFSFSVNNDVNSLVEKRIADAEKQLNGTLTPEQLKKWEEFRRNHSSVSVSHSTVIQSGNANGQTDEGLGF